MIGIMNSSTRDNIEFYASREENRIRKQESLEQTNAFTEVKRKPTVTYSEGGKLLLDGKLVDEIDGVKLWHEVIKKKAFSRSNNGDYPEEILEVDEDDTSSKESLDCKEDLRKYITTILIEEAEIQAAEREREKRHTNNE